MKKTHELKSGNYYLFESLSSAHSLYFESEEEIKLFKYLLVRYLNKYLEVHRIFIDKTGYQILVKIKDTRTIRSNYIKRCKKQNKRIRVDFIQRPWKIISEMMRVFKSVYVKAINRIRGREGVLVKHNFKKYYFESAAEYEGYIKKMEKGELIRSQRNKAYEVKGKKGKGIKWLVYRAKKWSERFVYEGFQDLVGHKLIKITLHHHSP
jgi:hypothetical protein